MLTLFPASSLDNSILTSVLIGLFVVWAFQETLGWNFTGLVVPGYLASIFTIHPATGMVVVSEALVTVAIVLLLSERVPAWWPWTRLFGRDRFFLFLLTSVAVRIALEGGGFDLARQALGLHVEEGLHSMGLVLVPLLANAFWRAGAGGMPRVAVPVLLTWALLEWVFVPFTNLSLSSFELTYEDLALNFVGSPRAYILLLIGAAMGSWANQRWGWDYGGIIVPGLLALCWSEPTSLAATIGEAVVIALLLKASFRLPGLRTANLTGGRPLVLAFALGYLTKFAMGWAFGGAWPGFAVRDLYGFGYLLSSIVALRIVKHGEPFRSVVPALATSLGAFVGGSTVAWALAVLLPAGAPPAPTDPEEAPAPAGDAWLAAAWGDGGAATGDLGGVAAADADALVTGPVGALRVRAGARPLAVVARVGPLAMDGAALAVADALDARALLLCAPTGAGCEGATAAIARGLPVLRVEAGDADVLSVSGALDRAVSLGRLGETVGAFRVDTREGPDALTLTTETRVRAAAGRLGGAPAGIEGPLPDALPGPARAPGAREARAFRETVLRPWLAGWGRAAWSDDGARLAAGSAAAMGLALARAGDVSVLAGPGWRMVADAAGKPVVIVVPDADDAGARAVGRALARATEAALLVEDAAAHEQAGAWTHAGLLVALDALGPAARVVTVRTVPDPVDPGADVVLSPGSHVPPGGDAPRHLDALAARLEGVGLRVALYDGSALRLGFADPGNPARDAARASAGDAAHATVFVTGPAARRFAPLAPDGPGGAVLATLVPERAADLRAFASAPTPTAAGPWRAALDTLLTTGRSGPLRALRDQALARGGEVARVRDPLVGVRWLAVTPCASCETTLLTLAPGSTGTGADADPGSRRSPPTGRGTPEALRGASAGAVPLAAPGGPLDALALGRADLVIGARP